MRLRPESQNSGGNVGDAAASGTRVLGGWLVLKKAPPLVQNLAQSIPGKVLVVLLVEVLDML